ncbi:MAG: toll/interleukin-1 receptor domain-containing protein [Bacteroidales bacterium]|nr:toll/interleukin-1 receptor domain-containing protein [Bacteroidales bacterium]
MNYDVFISYSRKDSKTAEEIYSTLSSAGLNCFIDKEGIAAGADFPEILANRIDESGVFLLLASKNAYQSKFTKNEILHAFKHKRSGCIIPYLIDDTPMPSDLEFLLGNVNWVDSKVKRISELPAIVRDALANPERGTVGGRKVKKSRIGWIILPLLLAAIAGVVMLLRKDYQEQSSNDAALQDRAALSASIARVDSLLRAGDALAHEDAIANTAAQIAVLQEASAELVRTDSIKALHSADEYAGMFVADLVPYRRTIGEKLDSIHKAWKEFAMDSYDLWRVTHSKSEAENVLQCIDYALSVKSDPTLESIRQKLTK